jgi:hypothetical protein
MKTQLELLNRIAQDIDLSRIYSIKLDSAGLHLQSHYNQSLIDHLTSCPCRIKSDDSFIEIYPSVYNGARFIFEHNEEDEL